MNKIDNEDQEALLSGQPPDNLELLQYLTVPNPWLETMKHYCIDKVIAEGGSKVKIIVGGAATGKSHYLRVIGEYAREEHFLVVNLDLSQIGFHLTDSVAFYKAIAKVVDLDELENTLTSKIIGSLGYDPQEFSSFGGTLTDYLCEVENSEPAIAKKNIRKCIYEIVDTLELEFAFRKFLNSFMEAVVEKDYDFKSIARDWIRGEKIERYSKSSSLLYETLARHNARSWLYSLVEIVKFMNYKGVVILLDQFESILPKSEAGIYYTPLKRNDSYELIRQLIDDLDFFKHILILISGRIELLDEEKYGLKSYHALWMRIQPGFEQQSKLNVYSDLIDADLIFRDLSQQGLLAELKQKFNSLGLSPSFDKRPLEANAGNSYRDFRDLIQSQIN